MMKKALFLDIDGVINTNTLRATKRCTFHETLGFGINLTKDHLNLDQRLIDILFTTVDDSTDIVISSMWRFGAKPEWFTQMFALYGKTVAPDRIKTIRCDTLEQQDGERQKFIQEFLDLNQYDGFAAIDDSKEHFLSDCEFLVLTDARVGITEYDATQLMKKINTRLT
jgi:hypothetical protein